VGPRAGLDVAEKRKILPLPGVDPRPSSPSLSAIFVYLQYINKYFRIIVVKKLLYVIYPSTQCIVHVSVAA
jgi:hypothetical protein